MADGSNRATQPAGIFSGDESGIGAAADAWTRELDAETGDEDSTGQADEAGQEDSDGSQDEGNLEPESDEVGDPEDEGTGETDDEGEEDSEEESEGEEEDDDTSAKPGEIDPETKVKVKADGEELEVTFDELKKGYSRQAHFTRQMQELAEGRKEVDEGKAQVRQQQQEWQNVLVQAAQRLQASISGRSQEQWDQLKQQDEITYYEEREKERQAEDRLRGIQQEYQRMQQVQEEQEQERVKTLAAQERKTLLDNLPDWQDNEVARREYQGILSYGQELGFSPQEINGIVDHRAVMVLRDAMKYRQLQKAQQKGKAQGKVRKQEKKPLRAGKPSNDRPADAKRKKALQRFAKSQSVHDAGEAFAQFLDE